MRISKCEYLGINLGSVFMIANSELR